MDSKRIKKLRMLFKSRKKLLTLAILGVFIIQIGYSILLKDSSSASSKNILAESSGLNISKTATRIGETDEYEIKFDITGHPEQLPKVKADIVIMVDESGSMNDKLPTVKSSIIKFCNDVVGTNADVKIAIGGFSSARKMYDGDNLLGNNETNSRVICNFESNLTTLSGAINGMTNKDFATNTEAGIYRAGKILDEGGRTGAKKYVIFFTDGLPTYSNNQKCSTNYYDKFFKAAQIQYNNIFGLKNIIVNGKVAVGGIGDQSVKENITPNASARHGDAKFYTIGVITTSNTSVNDRAKKFLYTIQNVTTKSQDDYVSKFYGNYTNIITTVFNNISETIKTEINKNIALNSVIKDTVSEEFTIPALADLVVTGIDKSKVTLTANNGITFDMGNIGENGVAFSFRVKAADPYFSGNEIETNDIATIDYNDPLDPDGQKKNKTFNIPTVNITPKSGIVKIQKVVGDGTDSTIKDAFSVVMNRDGGNGSYGFNQIGNSTGTISFYMKNINTNITKNLDMTKNYLNVGEYSIDEIVPIYYQLKDIKVDYNDGKGFIDLKTGNKITIDKDHKDITIRVTNSKVDGPYWWDKEDISNVFSYTK